jgi:26S proteasome regulatory subunit N1
MLESLKVINEPLRSFATVLVECCAYAGTGNVLKIQHMLHICSEHFDNKEEKKVNDFICLNQLKLFFHIGRRKGNIER